MFMHGLHVLVVVTRDSECARCNLLLGHEWKGDAALQADRHASGTPVIPAWAHARADDHHRVLREAWLARPVQGDSTLRHVKDLDVVLGAEANVVIMDDTSGVWPLHRPNLLLVRGAALSAQDIGAAPAMHCAEGAPQPDRDCCTRADMRQEGFPTGEGHHAQQA